jgi:DNA mismatch repair protein MutS2
MDKSALEILEFDKIKRMLSRCAASDLGRALSLELTPSSDLSTVREMQRETSEMKEAFGRGGRPPFGRLSDIRPLIRKASVAGAVMEGEELVRICWALSSARELKDYFLRLEGEFRIASYILPLDTLPDLEREIGRCLDDEGAVLDSASHKLARLKGELRVVRGRIVDRMNDMISGKESSFLQEPIVTIRNGRYVLPVKHDRRSFLKGIVHDQSASGSTIYVEPISLVEMNNRLQIILSEIDREILKILADLTAQVGRTTEELSRLTDVLATLDLIWARASLSLEIDGEEPQMDSGEGLDIIGGRHPLLELNEDLSRRELRAVPVDIALDGGGAALVITGPNTGGKTVALKLAGLLTLMAQGGLHISADRRSRIGVFSSVYADIGDEQSIEQSISTFSSHMGRIATILKEAGPKSLVLLDEIGAGTDPVEGAALAQAVLEHLHRRGATAIVTTHYEQLKRLAFDSEWAKNASVQFDMETLRPTYRLAIGLPGSSFALHIAGRLGLPDEVISRAKELLGSERLALGNLIKEMGELKEQVQVELRSASRMREEAEKLKTLYRGRMDELSSHRAQAAAIKREAYEEARGIIDKSRAKVEEAIETIRLEAASKESIKRAHRIVAEETSRIDDEIAKLNDREALPVAGLKVGGRVRIASMDKIGYLMEKPDGKDAVLVQVGTFKVQAAVKDLEALEDLPDERRQAGYTYRTTGDGLPGRLDIHGLRVEEALRLADKYLDDAVLMGMESVRIVHGRGTGALRSAIAEMLKGHAHVASFRPGSPEEGGMGVTVATLK